MNIKEGESRSPRKLFWGVTGGVGLVSAAVTALCPPVGISMLAGVGVWTAQAIRDTRQPEHSLLRNYKTFARARFGLERFTREIQQYFIEKDTDEVPFSREQRSLVYARSKNQNDKQSFGTLLDLQEVGAEWLTHSMLALDPKNLADPRVTIGGPDCKQPYSASIFNTSGMSFGSLSDAAVMALARGAGIDRFPELFPDKMNPKNLSPFYVNTGEGGLSPFHLGFNVDIEDKKFDFKAILKEAKKPFSSDDFKAQQAQKKLAPDAIKLQNQVGNPQANYGKLARLLRKKTAQYTRFPSGDVVWNIGTGYFGCRNKDGSFSAKQFQEKARLPQVKMIELKLSQGAKPGAGGILPASKISPGIAKLRGVEQGQDCVSPASHAEKGTFSTPKEMMQFIQKLRNLSGGKPVGFKLCIGREHEFLALCKAMVETGIYPDFITVDGAEGGTGAAPYESTNKLGMPLDDALVFVNNALKGIGARDKIKVIASGKVVDAADILEKVALGADLCAAARPMMFSIGCIQARRCHTNTCPTGVATQSRDLVKGLDPDDKGVRNANYHRNTVKEVRHLLAQMGMESTAEIRPDDVQRRVEPAVIHDLTRVYQQVPVGALLDKSLVSNLPEAFQQAWQQASADSFKPNS